MKLRITNAILLFLCFSLLALPAGAVPLRHAAAPEAETHSPAPTGTPAAETPRPTETPRSTETPRPTETPPELWPPAEMEPAAAAEGGPTVIAVTLTDEDPLDNDTSYDVDAEALLAEGPSLVLPAEGYQILIVHTHATEAYTQEADDRYEESDDHRTTDTDHSVVRVGEELARALEEQGLHVLHCTTLFDHPNYTGSYTRSGAAVEEYLAAYPGIRVVIDVHRDALGSGDTIYKTVADIDGLMAAQLMFVMGSDVNLENPDWEQNLTLALTLQQAANARYGTLMRPTNLCDYRYNQQLCPGSLLLEVGTAGNTLSEAITAVRLFAETAGPVLASYIED